MVPSLYVTRKRPLRTMVYSSNSGVCPGSTHPAGLRMWATLRRLSLVLSWPMYSSMILGMLPADCTRVGFSICFGNGLLPFSQLDVCHGEENTEQQIYRAKDCYQGSDAS